MTIYLDKDGEPREDVSFTNRLDRRKNIKVVEVVGCSPESFREARALRDIQMESFTQDGYQVMNHGPLRFVEDGPVVGWFVDAWKTIGLYQRKRTMQRKSNLVARPKPEPYPGDQPWHGNTPYYAMPGYVDHSGYIDKF